MKVVGSQGSLITFPSAPKNEGCRFPWLPLVIAAFCNLVKTQFPSQEVAVELEALHDEQPQLLRENVELHRWDVDVVGRDFSWKFVFVFLVVSL